MRGTHVNRCCFLHPRLGDGAYYRRRSGIEPRTASTWNVKRIRRFSVTGLTFVSNLGVACAVRKPHNRHSIGWMKTPIDYSR